MAKLTLQEQMLKAGLVSEKKLKKAKKGAKKSRLQAREVKAAVEEKKLQQIERDKELNEQNNQQRIKREIQVQIKQLISMNKLDLHGDIKYNFTDGTIVKSLYMNELIRNQLIKGILAIARDGDGYAVIPSSVANKVAQRDAEFIIDQKAQEPDTIAEDDPYADFVVPDDLMW